MQLALGRRAPAGRAVRAASLCASAGRCLLRGRAPGGQLARARRGGVAAGRRDRGGVARGRRLDGQHRGGARECVTRSTTEGNEIKYDRMRSNTVEMEGGEGTSNCTAGSEARELRVT